MAMLRHLRVVARNAGDVIRAGRGARILVPWGLNKRVLALEEASILNEVQGRSSQPGPHWMTMVRGAANDALDIVRYLEGVDETDESGRISGAEEDAGAHEVVGRGVRFGGLRENAGADDAGENDEEELSNSDIDTGLDYDAGEDESTDCGVGFGRFSASDGDSNDEEVGRRYSDSDGDSNGEEVGRRYSDSDGDSNGEEVGRRYSDSDGDSNGEEVGRRYSDSDGDSNGEEVGRRYSGSDGDSNDEEVGRRYSDSDGDEIVRLKPHADGIYRKVIDAIARPEALAVAFENLKKKYGKMMFRSHQSTDWRWCQQTADELRAGTYAFHPVRLVNVPVLGSNQKMRSIRVVSPKDQIVLEAFRAALEVIFVLFSPHVHKCKHTALEQVKKGWRGTSWFMEFCVEKSYDETNQKRLKNILSEKIEDRRFLGTLFQMFNADVIRLERTNIEEGGNLSSMLCNIYYQKLDEEVEAIINEWNSGAKDRGVNPAYRRLMVFDKRTMARLGGSAEQMRREKQHRMALARKLAISRKNYKDPNFTRVQYVRFGDAFLLGLSGSKSTGLKIMKRLNTFLQSNLQLQVNLEKTHLNHAVSDKTPFLGAFIRVLDPKELPEVSSSLTRALARKRAQTMRVKQQLDDRWTRECRNVVLKCWTVAYEKWRRDLGKDGAKKKTFEAATQQLLSMPEEDALVWREKAQDVLHVFISAALRQGLFPQDEVDNYYKVLASLEKSSAKVLQRNFEEDLDV